MRPVERVAGLAARRMLIRTIIARSGVALVVGASAAVVLAVVDRLGWLRLGPALILGTPLFIAAVWVVVNAWRERPTRLAAAQEVDSALHLSDRISTALSLGAEQDAFESLAVDAGESAARTASVSAAIPVNFGRAWAIWPTLLAIAGGLLILAPSGTDNKRGITRVAEERARRQSEVRAQLADAARSARQMVPPGEATPATQKQLQSLDDLVAELERGPESAMPAGSSNERSLDRAVSEAAESLSRLADAKEAQASRERDATNALRDRLSRVGAGDANETELGRALRSGDLEAASRAAEEVAREAENWDQSKRDRLAEDLRRLAEQIRELKPGVADVAPEPDAASVANDQRAREESTSGAAPPLNAPDPAGQKADSARSDRDQADVQRPAESKSIESPAARPDDVEPQPGNPESKASETKEQDPAGQRLDEMRRRLRDAAKELSQSPKPRSKETSGSESQAEKGATKRDSDASPRADGQASDPRSGQNSEDSRPTGTPESANTKDRDEGPSQHSERSRTSPNNPSGVKSSEFEAKSAKTQPETTSPGQSDPSGKPSDDKSGASKSPSGPANSDSESQTPSANGKRGETGTPAAGEQPTSSQSADGRPSNESAQQSTGSSKPSQSPDRSSQSGRHGESTTQAPGHPSSDMTDPRRDPSHTPASPSSKSGIPKSRPMPDGREPQADKSGPGSDSDRNSPPNSGGTATDRLRESLQRMASESDRSKQSRQDAAELRRRAQELYDSADPSQREQMQRWARQASEPRQARNRDAGSRAGSQAGGRGESDPRELAESQGQSIPPSATTSVNATEPNGQAPPNESVVAEWLGDGQERGKALDPARSDAARARLLEAARSAEQAIGDRAVPGRYDRVLREYFKRLPDTVLRRKTDAPAPAPAEDTP